jgi:hypothetical protein
MVQPAYRSSRLRLICRSCGHLSTVNAGTLFDKTRTPLRAWLAAAWYLTNHKQGVSALGPQHVLGLGSYQTAWTMLHRFRRATVRPDRDRLKGHIEVDETYLAVTDREAPTSGDARLRRACPCADGRRAPGGFAGQALDPANAPRVGSARASGRVPGRVRVPLQPPHFERARCCSTGSCSRPSSPEPVTYDNVVRPLAKPAT